MLEELGGRGKRRGRICVSARTRERERGGGGRRAVEVFFFFENERRNASFERNKTYIQLTSAAAPGFRHHAGELGRALSGHREQGRSRRRRGEKNPRFRQRRSQSTIDRQGRAFSVRPAAPRRGCGSSRSSARRAGAAAYRPHLERSDGFEETGRERERERDKPGRACSEPWPKREREGSTREKKKREVAAYSSIAQFSASRLATSRATMGASTSRPAPPPRQGPPPENGVRVTAGLLQRVVDQTTQGRGSEGGGKKQNDGGASTSSASPSNQQEQQQQQQPQQQQQQQQRRHHGNTRMFGFPDLR